MAQLRKGLVGTERILHEKQHLDLHYHRTPPGLWEEALGWKAGRMRSASTERSSQIF